MATTKNEGKSLAIVISAADHTYTFNSIMVTTTGTLKYDDMDGTTITIAQDVPVGKFEVAGTKVYKTGTTITGVFLANID